MLGGFVPRGWAQAAKDPAYCFFVGSLGFWLGDYLTMSLKFNAKSLIADPHRYLYNTHMDHH